MALEDRLQGLFTELSSLRAQQRDLPPHLRDGGGGGTSGGMEERLGKLEAHMEHANKAIDRLDRGQEAMRIDVETVKTDLATIKEQLRHLPTVTQMWLSAVGIVTALGAVIALCVRFLPHA